MFERFLAGLSTKTTSPEVSSDPMTDPEFLEKLKAQQEESPQEETKEEEPA